MKIALDDLFAQDGPVARAMGQGYEPRPQQVEMAAAVERAMARGGRAMVEAGTGVGKSFAYLLPALRRIVERDERVVVATNTIALQEQLLGKDIPTLRRVLDEAGVERSVRTALVKGRGNYVSIRRLQLASQRQDKLFADPAQRRSLHAVENWAYDTTDGTLATLPQLERPGVWDRVQSDAGNCMGRKCPTYKECFYQRDRRRMEGAHLLICNHAILCSDLALRRRGVALLPAFDHVVIDEAHSLEDVASDHFGLSLTEGRVRHLLNTLHQPRGGKGFLPSLSIKGESSLLDGAIRSALGAGESATLFFDQVAGLVHSRGSGEDGGATARIREPALDNMLSPAFRDLTLHLKRLRERAAKDEDRYELNAFVERAELIADEADALCEQSLEGCVYWAQTMRRERGVSASLSCSPIDVAPALREALFDLDCSVTLTSATLTTGGGSFEHMKTRLGCEGAETLSVGSPFDMASQVELIVDRTMPDPRSGGYIEALAARVLEHIDATDGGAFALFTSYSALNAVSDRIAPELAARGMPMWTQGRDGPRGAMLEAFRAADRGVLLGTTSFWQGVDVRGSALRNVIITRLPFEPPDRPLTEARHERLKERGGQPFRDDSLPRAVIRFKQGFGRLIRSASDTGRVVVLDQRLVSKPYGQAFLAAIPEGVTERMRIIDSEPDAAIHAGYPD